MPPSNEYIKEWRKTPAGQDGMRRQKKRERARRVAIAALIMSHPKEWHALLNAALVEEGLDPQ